MCRMSMRCSNRCLPCSVVSPHHSLTCQAEGIVIYATWQRYGDVFCFNLDIDIDTDSYLLEYWLNNKIIIF
jgi:hypothetical protein